MPLSSRTAGGWVGGGGAARLPEEEDNNKYRSISPRNSKGKIGGKRRSRKKGDVLGSKTNSKNEEVSAR